MAERKRPSLTAAEKLTLLLRLALVSPEVISIQGALLAASQRQPEPAVTPTSPAPPAAANPRPVPESERPHEAGS